MEMRHEAARLRNKVYDFVGEKIGLNRRNAVAFNSVDAVESLAEVEEGLVAPLSEITDIDACNDNLLATLGGGAARLLHNIGNRARTGAPARFGYGAICAPVIAAVLHFEKISGAVASGARWHEIA